RPRGLVVALPWIWMAAAGARMDPRSMRRPAAQVPLTVGTVEEADLCQTLAEYHGLQGRTVIGIVLRGHLDAQALTPTEIIHVHKLLRPLTEQGQLLESALAKIVAAQARQPGQDQRVRRVA